MKDLGRRPPDWDGHLLLLYRAEAQRRDGVAAWVKRGLELRSKILYTEPPHRPPERSLRGLLADRDDARAALDSGQIEVVVADEASYDPAWQLGVVEEALDQGYPSVRWSGEASTAWTLMPRERHADIEDATEQLCRSLPVSVMCQYAVPRSMEDLRRVSNAHGAGIRERLLHASLFPGGLVVAGEVDRSNHDIVVSLLSTATANGHDELVLDLSELEFLDVGAARSLVSGTARYRERGGFVRLEVSGPPVDSVIRMLGVDRAPGVLLEEV